jgi:hypothetical protein
MAKRREQITYINITTVVQRTGLERQMVQECVARRLVAEPMTDADLAELRRIRRLQELGVNIQGIEIILHMRQRILALQAERDRWQRTWAEADEAKPAEVWRRLLTWDLDA